MELRHRFDVSAAWLASVARLGRGLIVRGDLGPRPEKPLVLYEFEACPFCRKVREALTELDLEAEIRPCPRGGDRFRPEAIARGGKASFPYLLDPNQDAALYESDDIVRHLFRHYGNGSVPFGLSLGPLTDAGSVLASAYRPGRGSSARPSTAPELPLELWSFEASPYCRVVREFMTELELPYTLHNVGKRSPSRRAFVARSGKMMVPYLADPNTGVEMHESSDILRYLRSTYAR